MAQDNARGAAKNRPGDDSYSDYSDDYSGGEAGAKA